MIKTAADSAVCKGIMGYFYGMIADDRRQIYVLNISRFIPVLTRVNGFGGCIVSAVRLNFGH